MKPWIQELLTAYPDLEPCAVGVEQMYAILSRGFRDGNKLLICGNGGSAADCEHMVGELMKSFTVDRPIPGDLSGKLSQTPHGEYLRSHLQPALPALSLVSHSGLFTAFCNDVQPDLVFAQQVYGYGKPGDMVLGLSTSGNSRNVVYALELAKVLGMSTVGMTGESGGAMTEFCDVLIRVPYQATAQVQERHLPIYHAVCAALEREFFGASSGRSTCLSGEKNDSLTRTGRSER